MDQGTVHLLAVVPGKGFKAKLDASAYKEYTNTATFVTWKQAWIVTARAQGLGDLFDLTINLAMLDPQETDTYQRMSAWMYGVMWYKVKTINGQMIVKSHILDYDIRAIMQSLERDATQSTQGRLHMRASLQNIISMRLTSEWKRPYLDFVITMEKRIIDYNAQQSGPATQINEDMIRQYIEAAVAPC